MKRRRQHSRRDMAARALIALALVLVAFAHKPLGLSWTADASAYVLPDGQVPVICTTASDEHGADHTLHASVCDACLICGSILVPAPALLAAPAPIDSVALAVERTLPVVERAAWPPSAPPHAPPSAV